MSATRATEHGLLPGRDVLAVDISAGVGLAVAASRVVVGGAVRELCGFSLAETTGAAVATVELHDGPGAGSALLVSVNLAANESSREFWQPQGVLVPTGKIFLVVVAGSVKGTVFVKLGR